MSYIELHAHSAYSFLDGASLPEELAVRAAELSYPALALTDHDGVYGSLEFAHAAKAVGGVRVGAVREEWLVTDRWWTEEPLRRRYFDLVLETGENVAVFHDEERGGWFRQKA